MADQAKQKFTYYHYDPSLGGEVAFIVVFALITIGHFIWIFRKKTWYFIPFVIGCLFEAIGYAGRAIQATQEPHEWNRGPYILQALTILLAPALFAASIYMVLGRIIRLLDAAHLSLVRTTWLTKIFVAGDVLSFAAQGAGGGLLSSAKNKKDQDLGNTIILVGLGIQVVVFGLFIVTTVLFHLRIGKQPTSRSFGVTTDWRGMIWVLYGSSGLIMIRSLFRMIEYAMGWDNVLMQSEVYLFVLDGLLMVFVGAIFLWWHPGRVLIGYKEIGKGGKGNGGSGLESSAEEGLSDGRGMGSRGESQYEMIDRSRAGGQ
ncbi:RTA1 like domain containing protein [Naviculisporaceae sp. PSN 640]